MGVKGANAVSGSAIFEHALYKYAKRAFTLAIVNNQGRV
jgi:hypothetical protein